MQLRGLDVSAFLRLTQPDDVLDIEIELLKTTASTITPAFYALLFFDLMNGTVTGADDVGNGIVTGISFVIKAPDDSTLATTNKSKLDWYESNDTYFIEAISTTTVNFAEDKLIKEVEIYYTANDVEAGAAKDVMIAQSSAPSISTFSTSTPDGKGILIPMGQLVITGRYIVSVNK